MHVTLQNEAFDPGANLNAFIAGRENAGAAVSFVGTVRSSANKPVETLTLEHYAVLAQRQIEKFVQQALTKFDLIDIQVTHRFGTLKRGDIIVQVLALSAHRQAAFDGANYVMDWLKTDAPFWKQEKSADGTHWVSSRAQDEAAKDKWR